jgi:hypothetical protein
MIVSEASVDLLFSWFQNLDMNLGACLESGQVTSRNRVDGQPSIRSNIGSASETITMISRLVCLSCLLRCLQLSFLYMMYMPCMSRYKFLLSLIHESSHFTR